MTDLVPRIAGLSDIVDRYDAVILDLWGVIHDGIALYPGTRGALDGLRAAGKAIGLLSNAPRRLPAVTEKLTGLGLVPQDWDVLLSSGEATHAALADPPDADHAALGRRAFFIGAHTDDDVVAGTGVSLTDDPATADFLLVTGIDREDRRIEEYEARLQAARARDLTLVCANPDKVVVIGDRLALCAGGIAQRYAELGGRCLYHGKPHAPVYRRLLAEMGDPDPARVLAVGDSFATDVAGAQAAGIDCLLVAGGIHAAELVGPDGAVDADAVTAVAAVSGHRPVAAIHRLAW